MRRSFLGFLFFHLVMVLGLSLAGSRPCMAQDPDQVRTPMGQETIVVVGENVPVPLRSATRDIRVVDLDAARKAGFTTVADVLRAYAGLNVIASGVLPGSVTSVFLRGGESSYTLILVDDVEVNTVGGFYDLGNLSLDNVERIEILKGPGSTIYGSEAVSGIIRIYTDKGTREPRLRFQGQAGSFRTFLGAVQARGPLHEQVRFSVGISRLTTDRQRPINDAYRRTSISLGLDVTPARGHGLQVRYRRGAYNIHFPTQSAGDLFDILDPGQFTEVGEHIATLRWDAQWTSRISSLFTVGFYQQNLFYDDADDGPAIDPFGAFWSRLRDRRWKLDGRTTFRAGSHDLSVGLTWEREAEHSENIFSVQTDAWDRSNFAVYLLDRYTHAAGRWSVTAGLRYETHSDYHSVLAPQLGIAFWPGARWKVRASLGVGYKAPAFFQVHGLPGFITGNPELDPERNFGWDMSLEYWNSVEYPTVRVTYFENRFRDIIEFVFDADPLRPDYYNVEAARSRGLEIDVEFRVSHWDARLTYTYLDTQTTDAGRSQAPWDALVEGEPLLRRPRHRATLRFGYQGRNFAGGVEVVYQGRRWDLDFHRGFPPQRVELAGYVRVDAQARVRVQEHAFLLVRVENLFNRRYQEIFGFSGNRRGVYAGLEVTL